MLSEMEFFKQFEIELKRQGIPFTKVYEDGKCVGYKGIGIVESISGMAIYRHYMKDGGQANN